MVCTEMEIKMSLLKDLHFVGLEGPRTSFLGFVVSISSVIYFTTSGERQARLKAWCGESFNKYFTKGPRQL